MGADHEPTNHHLGVGETEPYRKTDVLLLDARPRPSKSSEPGFGIQSVHSQQLVNVYRLFKKFFNANTKCVRFPEGKSSSDVEKYFQTKFAPRAGTPSKKLTVIYFNGSGGNRGKNYVWRFLGEGSMSEEFKAYKIIDAIVKSGTDALIILDCYIPSRFVDKWQSGSGTVRILARGEEFQNTSGDKLTGADFTTAMLKCIIQFVTKDCRTWIAPTTINQLMRFDRTLTGNPKALSISGYVAPGERVDGRSYREVSQFVMIPKHVRETRNITFFRKVIQATQNSEGDAAITDLVMRQYVDPEEQPGDDGELFVPMYEDDEGLSEVTGTAD